MCHTHWCTTTFALFYSGNEAAKLFQRDLYVILKIPPILTVRISYATWAENGEVVAMKQ